MDEDEHDKVVPENFVEELLLTEETEPVSESHHGVEDNHRGSFITLTEGESSLPEIQRLQGLFESIDHELEDIQVTHINSTYDSDLESDDGLKKEVRELPNSSIHDLHTISTSAKGQHFLVTPNSATKSRSGGDEEPHLHMHTHHSADFPATPFAAKHAYSHAHSECIPENDAEASPEDAVSANIKAIMATPARVTFGTVETDQDDPTQSLDDLLNAISTPSAYNNDNTNKTPQSAGQHGFTPMTLQELMKLETPESKVDEMLQELYNLMGYYNTPAEYQDNTINTGISGMGGSMDIGSGSVRSSDMYSDSGSDRVVLFGSPSPTGSGAGSVDNSGIVVDGHVLTPPRTPTHTTDVSSATTNNTTDTTTKANDNNTTTDTAATTTTDTTNPTTTPPTTSTTTTSTYTLHHPLADTTSTSRNRLRSASVDVDTDIQDIMQMSIHPTKGNNNTTPHSPLDRSTFNAGWVDVSSKHNTPHKPTTSNTSTSGTNTSGKYGTASANKLHESIVHGDFFIWSSGVKLTAESINSGYVGMNRTSVTHNNDNGVLVPATLPSPSVPGSQLPREVNIHTIASTTGNNTTTHPNNTHPSTTNTTNPATNTAHTHARDTKHGYYVVYLLECVVRPDIELRDLLACVLKVARTRDCKAIFPHNNHIVLKSQSPAGLQLPPSTHHAAHNALTTHTPHTTTANPNPINVEWDQVDVQVVVSNAVKQRMLVCQFLRRVPSLTSSGFGNLNLIIYQIAGGAAPLSLENSPKTKSFVSKLKRELTEANLCFSSLYNAPLETVCRLPHQGGLDAHFRAQLHQQVYGHMWSRLEGDVKGMSEHLQAQLKECNEFMHTLEPIYKTYGMANPLPWSSSSNRHHTPLTTNTHSNNNTTGSTSGSVAHTPIGIGKNINILHSPTSTSKSMHSNHNVHNTHNAHNMNTPTTVNGISIAPSTADRILDNYLNNSTPVHTTSNTTPFKTGTTNTATTTPYTNTTTPYAHSNTTSTIAIDTTPHTPTTPHHTLASASTSPLPLKYSAVEDGMTVVLLTLSDTLQELQDSCDEEYARRVQMQNEWVVRQVDNMQDYKQSLLFNIAANLDAEDSALMKTFNATFYDVPTTIDVFGNTAFKSRDSSRSNSKGNSRTNSADSGGGVLVSSIVGGGTVHVATHSGGSNTASAASATTPGTTTSSDVYSDILVEASLFNEFLDSPPPKPLNSTTSTTSSSSNTTSTGNAVGSSSTTYSNATTTSNTTAPTSAGKGGWMSSLISSFYNNPVTQENASIGFKPKELRPKQTQADVNKRLLNYHTHNTTTNNTNNNTTNTARRRSTSTDRTTHATYTTGTHVHSEGKGLSMEDYQEVESLISLTPIVLYYCSCLVAKMPGTVYITPTTLCVVYSSGLLTMQKTKEIYPLTALHTVYLPSEWQSGSNKYTGNNGGNSTTNNNTRSMLDSNALQLVFYKTNLSPVKMHLGSARSSSVPSSRDLLIAPMLLDCVKLRNIIVEVKNAFNS